MNTYIFNLETTRIELPFRKIEFNELCPELKDELKNAFLWSNTSKCWVSRAKEPNLSRAKEVANKLGFTIEERRGRRLTYAEQIVRRIYRAKERAMHYEKCAAEADKRGDQLQEPLERLHKTTAFNIQPNIYTPAGQAFIKYRERLCAQYDKGFDEYNKSEQFKEQAAIARESAAQIKLRDPIYLKRSINQCKREINQREITLANYRETLKHLEQGNGRKMHTNNYIAAEDLPLLIDRELELVDVVKDKLTYFQCCLNELDSIQENN